MADNPWSSLILAALLLIGWALHHWGRRRQAMRKPRPPFRNAAHFRLREREAPYDIEDE